MVEIYRRFPRYMGTTLRSIVDLLLGDGAPLLVHCSAGKDRTGFVVAMLLHALEVPRDIITEDYLASQGWPGGESHRASLAKRLGVIVPPAALGGVVDAVLSVRESYLESALSAVMSDYGSIEQYLESEVGLEESRRERLRAHLLA